MPMAQVKEGVFHTSHRSSSQIQAGRMPGDAHHEVQFGGSSPMNLKTHTILPHLDEMRQQGSKDEHSSWKALTNLHHTK